MSSLPIRRVDFITIYSTNLEASRRFYVDTLEFPLVHEVPDEFFQINLAGVPICIDLKKGATQHSNIGLEVDDLIATTAVLRGKGLAGHPGSNPASKEEWVTVADPDGNEIVFLIRQPAARNAG